MEVAGITSMIAVMAPPDRFPWAPLIKKNKLKVAEWTNHIAESW